MRSKPFSAAQTLTRSEATKFSGTEVARLRAVPLLLFWLLVTGLWLALRSGMRLRCVSDAFALPSLFDTPHLTDALAAAFTDLAAYFDSSSSHRFCRQPSGDSVKNQRRTASVFARSAFDFALVIAYRNDWSSGSGFS